MNAPNRRAARKSKRRPKVARLLRNLAWMNLTLGSKVSPTLKEVFLSWAESIEIDVCQGKLHMALHTAQCIREVVERWEKSGRLGRHSLAYNPGG